jgi:hypothetical protein
VVSASLGVFTKRLYAGLLVENTKQGGIRSAEYASLGVFTKRLYGGLLGENTKQGGKYGVLKSNSL